MHFGSLWDGFLVPKCLSKIMFFLSAFCMLSGLRAAGTQAGSFRGAYGDGVFFGLQGRMQEGETKQLGT